MESSNRVKNCFAWYDYEELLAGFDDPTIHKSWGYISDDDRFDVPSLMLDTWYDYGVRYSFDLNQRLAQSDQPNHILITPGTHCDFGGAFSYGFVGDVPVGDANVIDFDAHYLRFMDHHLKDNAAPFSAPAFQTYMLQEDIWLETQNWPPKQAQKRAFYLDADRLTTKAALAVSRRTYINDPNDPVPTLGGAICCTGDPNSRSGPVHQNSIEGRDDLLMFTTSILEQPLRIAGPLNAQLFVSADVLDADLIVRLTDIAPDGTSTMIQEGSLRLRYRNGFDQTALMKQGEIYEVSVSLRDIAYRVETGHQLRMHIASSSFPRLARNMNTGGDPYAEDTPKVAKMTIHSGPEYPSRIEVFDLPE